MIGAIESSICPLCGGRLESGVANIPFILEDTIVVVKNTPALICTDCYEPYLDGPVTDQVMSLLTQLQTLRSEVSVISYAEPALV